MLRGMVNATTSQQTRPLRAELTEIVERGAQRNKEHPYYRALRDGSLPGIVYAHFSRQDSYYVLPSYGKAHARCAGVARELAHARFLGRMAAICLDNSVADGRELEATARRLDLPVDPAGERPPIAPATLSYTSFLTAASVTSFTAGLGALLPCAWLQWLVSEDLLARHEPGSRYAELIRTSHPGEPFRELVEEFLTVVDEVGDGCSAAEREELVRHVEYAVRYEWALVEAAWRLESWPL